MLININAYCNYVNSNLLFYFNTPNYYYCNSLNSFKRLRNAS